MQEEFLMLGNHAYTGYNIKHGFTCKKLLWIGSAKKDLMAMPPDVKDTFLLVMHYIKPKSEKNTHKPSH